MATIEEFRKEWESDCEYIVAHTSGSTGIPKEIHLLKSDMEVSAKATNRRFGINGHSVIGTPLSVDYIAGKMMVIRALVAGCQLIEMPVSNDINVQCEIDLLAVVPSQIESLLARPEKLAMIRNLIVGGAPIPPDLSEKLSRTGVNAYATYGMTETCSHVALAPIGGREQIFTAMPGVEFEVDERECLVIVAPEYSFKRLTTNDIVELRSSTDFVWVGRYDNVINSGGIKIFPEKLEKEIAQLIDKPFAVGKTRDSQWGEVPILFFEGSMNDENMIFERLRSNIDHRCCPKKVIAIDALPRTSNGKISRKELSIS